MVMQPHNPGEPVYNWLQRNFDEAITKIHGSNRVSVGPKYSGSVALDVKAGGSAKLALFHANLTGFKRMKVATPTIAGTFLVDHPHRYWYSFVEANLEMECLDGQGTPIQDQSTCKPTQPRRVTAVGDTDLRIGVLDWPDPEDDPDLKPAINLAELHHLTPPLTNDGTFQTDTSQPWYIYGVDIHSAWYGSGVSPQPPTSNGSGISSYVLNVPMYEHTDSDGDVIRWFNWPGLHLGECS